MNEGRIVLKIIFDALGSKDFAEKERQELSLYLGKIPLRDLTFDEYEELLSVMLNTCVLHNNAEGAYVIVEYFSNYFPFVSSVPLFTYLFTSMKYSINSLSLLLPLYPDLSFFDHMCNLADYSDGEEARSGAERLARVYGPSVTPEGPGYDLDVLERIIAYAESVDCDPVVTVCEGLICKVAPPVSRPEWMLPRTESEAGPGLETGPRTEPDMETGPVCPYEDEIPLPEVPEAFCDTDDVVDRVTDLTEELVDFGITTKNMPEAREYLVRLLSAATEDDRQEVIGCGVPGCKGRCEHDDFDYVDKQLALHDQVFRILGPLNARQNTKQGDDVCARYGGCRMFTCVCHETYDPDDDTIDPEPDWFNGVCMYQRCRHPIPNRYWATRRPLLGGGWKGCYCSWECVKDDLRSEESRRALELLTTTTDRLEGDMSRIGILDRRVRDNGDYRSPWERMQGNRIVSNAGQ